MKKKTNFSKILLSFFLFSLITNASFSRQNDTDFKMEVLYPLYVYPYLNGTASDANFKWQKIIDAQKDVDVTVVINPNDGPLLTKGDFTNYKSAIEKLREAGVLVLGYIRTGWFGNATDASHAYYHRPRDLILNQIECDLKSYSGYFKTNGITLDGIFFDEGSSRGEDLAYYNTIYNKVKNINPNWVVVVNPGTHTDVDYLDRYNGMKGADIVMSFEKSQAALYAHLIEDDNPNNDVDQQTDYFTYNPTPSPYQHSTVVHSATNTVANINKIIDDTRNKNIGYIFITDDVMNNPYDATPNQVWDRMISHIQTINNNKKERPFVIGENRVLYSVRTEAKEVAIGGTASNTKIYKIKSNDQISYWDNNQWKSMDGLLTKIVSDEDGYLWGINKNGDVYRRVSPTKSWEPLGSVKARDISVAGKGASKKAYILHKTEKVGGPVTPLKPTGYKIMEFSNNTFIAKTDGAAKIAVDKQGNLWAIDNPFNSFNVVYFLPNGSNSWEQKSYLSDTNSNVRLGTPKDIKTGADGNVYILDNRNYITTYNNQKSYWEKVVTSTGATSFSISTNGAPWLIKDGKIQQPRVY